MHILLFLRYPMLKQLSLILVLSLLQFVISLTYPNCNFRANTFLDVDYELVCGTYAEVGDSFGSTYALGVGSFNGDDDEIAITYIGTTSLQINQRYSTLAAAAATAGVAQNDLWICVWDTPAGTACEQYLLSQVYTDENTDNCYLDDDTEVLFSNDFNQMLQSCACFGFV